MRIIAFRISIGGYSSGGREIRKEGRDLVYYTREFPFAPPEHEPVRIRPSKEAWEQFFDRIKPFASTWRKEYRTEMCDGIQWDVKIVTDKLSLKSFGSNDFPDEFDNFMLAVHGLTEVDG